MPSGHVVKLGDYSRQFSDEEYEQGGDRRVSVTMVICDGDNPPAYETNSGIFPRLSVHSWE